MALYSHQGPYFCQIKSDFTLCMEHLGLQRFVPCATIPGNGKFWIVDWIKYGGQQQGQVPVSQVEKIKEKKIYKGKTLVKDVGKYNFCIEFLGSTHYTGWKKVFKAILASDCYHCIACFFLLYCLQT